MIDIQEPIKIKALFNDNVKGAFPSLFTEAEIKSVKRFHMAFANYRATPLISLSDLAKKMGVAKVFVKDESYRFGLNAFKVLGGAYAMAKVVCQKLGIDSNRIDFNVLKSSEVKNNLGQITFVTATDGNHGRGVAWAAKELGHKAVVYLPKGAAKRRVEAIKEMGAEVFVTDLNYDDAVSLAFQKAQEQGWYLVQDTAWEGYEEIPSWIMQGYTTMADEAVQQMELEGVEKPTHIFLQAGVGAMAGAVLGYCVNKFKGNHPKTIVMEPDKAACIFKSAVAGDGHPHGVSGDLDTIMVGLACGVPNPLGWKILRDFASAYVSCPDYVAARGIRILANPLGDDKRVVAGESGAVGIGLLSLLMEVPQLKGIKDKLGLNEDSVILFFSTEGDTDPVNYRKILWDGKYSL